MKEVIYRNLGVEYKYFKNGLYYKNKEWKRGQVLLSPELEVFWAGAEPVTDKKNSSCGCNNQRRY